MLNFKLHEYDKTKWHCCHSKKEEKKFEKDNKENNKTATKLQGNKKEKLKWPAKKNKHKTKGK